MAIAAVLDRGLDTHDTPEVDVRMESLYRLDKGYEAEERDIRLRARFSKEALASEDEALTAERMLKAIIETINTTDRQHAHTLIIGKKASFIGSKVKEIWTKLSDSEVIITRSPFHFGSELELEALPGSTGSFYTNEKGALKDPSTQLHPRYPVSVDASNAGYLTIPLTEENSLTILFEPME